MMMMIMIAVRTNKQIIWNLYIQINKHIDIEWWKKNEIGSNTTFQLISEFISLISKIFSDWIITNQAMVAEKNKKKTPTAESI